MSLSPGMRCVGGLGSLHGEGQATWACVLRLIWSLPMSMLGRFPGQRKLGATFPFPLSSEMYGFPWIRECMLGTFISDILLTLPGVCDTQEMAVGTTPGTFLSNALICFPCSGSSPGKDLSHLKYRKKILEVHEYPVILISGTNCRVSIFHKHSSAQTASCHSSWPLPQENHISLCWKVSEGILLGLEFLIMSVFE